MVSITKLKAILSLPIILSIFTLTFFSCWEEQTVGSDETPTFTVTYSASDTTGGDIPIDSIKYESFDTVTVLDNSDSLVKDGFVFSGWNTIADGSGITYLPGATFIMGATNVVLYAQWTAIKTYKVTYNGNGNDSGVVPEDSLSYNKGDTVNVAGNIGGLKKSGHTFLGWSLTTDGALVSNNLLIDTNDVTLYAQWSSNPTYTVTYDGNSNEGGTVPVDNNNYEKGSTVTVLGNISSLTKTGHTFIGWSAAADGPLVGATLIVDTADITLYAQWSTNPTFNVTYNGNGNDGGAVSVDINNYESGATVTVLGNTGALTKTGHTFIGWSATVDGDLVDATFLMGTADVVLYAKWSTNPTYTITYNGNGNDGGAVPVDTKNYENGATVTVLGNTGSLTKSGYTFTGWSVEEDGDLVGATFLMGAANVILYAQWSANPTFSVTYSGNGNTAGAVPEDANKYEEGSIITIPGNSGNLEKTGYSFIGWSLNQDGSGELYGVAGKTTLAMGSVDVKFWAQWEINSYKIAFETNGGSTVDTQVVAYNAYATDPVVPTKSGHTFAGWYTSQQFTIAFDFAGTAITADRTLYAKWTVNQYSVIYNSNDATSGSVPASTDHDYNSLVTLAGNTNGLKRFGYEFLGWSLTASADSVITSFTMDTSDVNLYPKWSVVQKYRNMTLIHAKDSSFMMGSENAGDVEKPVHKVNFTYDFYMDTTEVTQGDYDVVMSSYPGYTSPSWNGMKGYGLNYPAYYIHWDDAVLYCNARSKAEGKDTVYIYSSIREIRDNRFILDGFSMDISRNGYRLPTEAEWEYACRAGTTTDFYWDQVDTTTNDCAWYNVNSNETSHEVAEKIPNKFGLYDMPGNLFEWCNDWYGNYLAGDQENPIGPISGSDRVLRGGSYSWSNENEMRSAFRCGSTPEYNSIGFRVVLPGE